MELERFRKYLDSKDAMEDGEGNTVKVKWVRVHKGTRENPDVRCRLVALELGYGERLDELFAGTPSLMVVKMLLLKVSMKPKELGVIVLDVRCVFFYSKMRRRVYIELPEQDPESKKKDKMGRLAKAMYGTRDAPQIWSGEVCREMIAKGFQPSVLHPSVFSMPEKDMHVVVHVDDFLCVGPWSELEWLYDSLKQVYDLKSTLVRGGTGGQGLESGYRGNGRRSELGAGSKASGNSKGGIWHAAMR